MKIIGITGGVGAGKSRVLRFMEAEMDALVCQADEVARQLQQPGEVCYQPIVALFGQDILDSDGRIDRTKLGTVVFADGEKLAALNRLVHPQVKQRIIEKIERARECGRELFVIEAALLIEDHYDMICDELWYIYASEDVRRTRLKESRDYSDEKIDRIFSSQASEEVFRTRCQHIIDNSGSFAETIKQIRNLGENKSDEIM